MRLGENSKPAVGDILVSIAGYSLSKVSSLDQIVLYLKHVLQKPPVTLMFIEAPRFAEHFNQRMIQIAEMAKAVNAPKAGNAPQPTQPPTDNDGVIYLIDDV
jgi:hypothetical protein